MAWKYIFTYFLISGSKPGNGPDLQSPKITVDWKRIKLTPPKSNVEIHHASTDKSNHDHLIKMYAFNKHPSEHRHKEVE